MGRTMNTRTVRKLTDLEIDEVSLVDRPANQHGLVAFAKAYEEASMGIYDASGAEVYEDELEHGDVVYDDAGNEYQFVEEIEDDTSAELQSGHDYEDEFDDELVGKASWAGARAGLKSLRTAEGRGAAATRGRVEVGRMKVKGRNSVNSVRQEAGVRGLTGRGAIGPNQDVAAAAGTRRGARSYGLQAAMQARAGIGRAPIAAVAGGTAGGAGLGYGYSRTKKSLGESVYEELSKALTSDDRDAVISKAMDRVSKAEERAEYLESVVGDLVENQELEEFTEIAKGYGLPVEPTRLGRILKSAAATMEDEDLRELDRLLTAQGSMYEALGSDLGGQDSEIHAQIEAIALDAVGKADITFEQGVVATYEANPAAYDEYLAESR